MDEENGIVIKYKLTSEVLRPGVAASYNLRYKYRRWVIWGLSVFLICIGLLTYNPKADFYNQFLKIFLVVMGVIYLCHKLIYVSRSVKAVFAGKEKLIKVKFIAKENSFQMITDDQEFTSKWKSIIKYHIVNEGILLYPQKNIFYYIPLDASEITGGSWDELTGVIQRNVRI